MSVLLIDIGNTRLKWQLRHNSQIIKEGVGEHELSWLEQLALASCKQVVVASVKERPAIEQVLNQAFGQKLTWLSQPLRHYQPFQHCYTHPERLGVDRWLTMLGARALTTKNALVVDAGTALTVDLLDSSNRHLGGYIVPGLSLSQQALFANTDKVRAFANELASSSIDLGQDTLSCVTAGLQRQRLAFIQSLQNDYNGFELFISGGDGEWLARCLKTHYYPHLIFEGMDSLCAGL